MDGTMMEVGDMREVKITNVRLMWMVMSANFNVYGVLLRLIDIG